MLVYQRVIGKNIGTELQIAVQISHQVDHHHWIIGPFIGPIVK